MSHKTPKIEQITVLRSSYFVFWTRFHWYPVRMYIFDYRPNIVHLIYVLLILILVLSVWLNQAIAAENSKPNRLFENWWLNLFLFLMSVALPVPIDELKTPKAVHVHRSHRICETIPIYKIQSYWKRNLLNLISLHFLRFTHILINETSTLISKYLWKYRTMGTRALWIGVTFEAPGMNDSHNAP